MTDEVTIRREGDYVVVRRAGREVLRYDPWRDGSLMYPSGEAGDYVPDLPEAAGSDTGPGEPALSESDPFRVLLILVLTGGGALAVAMTIAALLISGSGDRRLLTQLEWILAALGFTTWIVFRDWRQAVGEDSREAGLGAQPPAKK